MSSLRGLAIPIGAIAAILLFLLFNPWLVIEDATIRPILTVAFWVSFIVLLLALFEDRKNPESKEVEIEGPAFTRFLFSNSRAGLFWLPIRLFVGFSWLVCLTRKFLAVNALGAVYPNTTPRNWFVPALLTALTMAPLARPYSASYMLVRTWNSWIASSGVRTCAPELVPSASSAL